MNPKIVRLSKLYFGTDISDYALVVGNPYESDKLQVFLTSVRKHIGDGWIPLGGPFILVEGKQIVQAMVR